MSDARLREAYTRAVARRAGASRAACPAPEALLALVRREGGEAERIALLDHVLTCPTCREELELLRAIEAAGGESSQPRAHRPWRPLASLALAATVLLAVWLGTGRPGGRAASDDVVRGAEDVVVVLPADAAAGAASVAPASAPFTAAWRAVPGARDYTLELLTAEGAVLLAAPTSDTTVTLAAGRLPAPGDYRWWVRAAMPGGSERRSAVRRLRVIQ